MFVKCGGICSSLMSSRLMSTRSRTTGSKIVTGLGISVAISPGAPRLGERVHLDELQVVAGILAADQAVERQAHPLDVDVLPVVAHRAAHVHQHDGGALGRVARAMDLDVVRLEPQRQARARRGAWR